VRAVNIEQSIDLYEIVAAAPADWGERCRSYQEALTALEREEIDAARRMARELASRFPHDLAMTALALRAAGAEQQLNTGDTSVWRLPGK
jgi:hypothetical protein